MLKFKRRRFPRYLYSKSFLDLLALYGYFTTNFNQASLTKCQLAIKSLTSGYKTRSGNKAELLGPANNMGWNLEACLNI